MLNRLVPANQLSMRCYGEGVFERSRRVMKAVEQINAQYGRDTVRLGTARPDGRWQTKFLRRSLNYATCLQDVLCID